MMNSSTILLLLLLLILAKSYDDEWNEQKTRWIERVDDKEDDDVSDTAQKVQAVLGKWANLPCEAENKQSEDRVYMVLWFKKNIEKPIYSFDVRGRPFPKALHWSDENFFGPRAYFVTTKEPASLQVDNVQLQDEGVYRCRVDFKNAPTKNFQIDLTVIVPPYQILLFDSSGRELGDTIGPLYEGSNLTITCEVRGGKPKPNVIWISSVDGNVLENVKGNANGNVAISKLEQHNLSRAYADAKYTCVSTNTNLTLPVTKSVILQLYLRPLYVKIADKPTHLKANKVYKLTCISSGSKPAATLTWRKNNSGINNTEFKANFNNNNNRVIADEDTSSVSYSINFIPKPEDNGLSMKCVAVNPKIDGFALEDTFRLNVLYAPIVNLELGSNLNINNIKEGDDVYFECKTHSNPSEQKIEWFHNGVKINQKIMSKVIMSRYNLVLQLINRHNSGYYTCSVTNSIAETVSKPVKLRVKYVPICNNKNPYVIGASLGETVHAKCSVSADPTEVVFTWIFNNSDQSLQVPTGKYQSLNSTVSKITYNIASEKDYGTLVCVTRNEIGRQIRPCTFRVVPAAHPTTPHNCSIHRALTNITAEILEVYCFVDNNNNNNNGDDDEGLAVGGAGQTYHLEVIETFATASIAIINSTSLEYPIFRVDLSPHVQTIKNDLQFVVYSSNNKGVSERVTLQYNLHTRSQQNAEFTMEKNSSSNSERTFVLTLTSVVAVTAIISGLLMAIVSLKRWRKHHDVSRSIVENSMIKKIDLKGENENKYVLSYQVQVNQIQPDILHRVETTDNDVVTEESSSSTVKNHSNVVIGHGNSYQQIKDNNIEQKADENEEFVPKKFHAAKFDDGNLTEENFTNSNEHDKNKTTTVPGNNTAIFGPESRV